VATDLQAAALDAFQDLDGGPCVQAVHDNEVLDVETALSEEHWSMYARATAAKGIQSSLSMPLVDRARVVVGGVNLYASAPGVFEDHIDEVAEVVGAWAPAAVRDADLSFSSRLRAAEAPGVLADQADVDMATGLLAASQHIDTTTAEQRLREAAKRVGIAPADVARTVIEVHTARTD
jgi:GAF domain-containing protein